MNDIQTRIWQNLLELLADPAILGALGSFFITLLAFFSKAVKNYILKLLSTLKRKLTPKGPVEHVIDEHYCTTSLMIHDQIATLRNTLDCSRVAVLQFRNGTLFTLSAPMFRVYCSYEALRPGIKSSCSDFSERIGTTIIEFLGPLLNNNVKMPGVQEVKACKLANTACPRTATGFNILKFETDHIPYCEFQCMLRQAGIRVLYAVLLKSGTNPIGVLTMHYLVEQDADKLITPHACTTCEVAHTIQTLLDVRSH